MVQGPQGRTGRAVGEIFHILTHFPLLGHWGWWGYSKAMINYLLKCLVGVEIENNLNDCFRETLKCKGKMIQKECKGCKTGCLNIT